MAMRVMLVDDNENDLLYTRIVLERCGLAVEVQAFEFARQALQSLADGSAGGVDIILLDINMPGMDGFEFLDAYQALTDARRARAAVVMLTSSSHGADRERAMAYACVKGYVVKPIDVETACALVRHVER